MSKIKCSQCDKHFNSQQALDMHTGSKHVSGIKRRTSKLIFAGIAILLIIVASALFFALKPKQASTDATQKITLGFSGNYEPNVISVKQGVPVEITLDESVRGCFRAFTIPALKVSKISRSESDTIKFTPDKPGIFRFQCGMNMGYGTIIVN